MDYRECGGLIVDAIGSLHRAGWTISSTAFATTDGGSVWVVSGHNGENLIRADAETEAEAWHRAVDQARSVGILEGIIRGDPGLC